ncbi:MAG: hypothetical protein ACXWL5_02075 [Candidatus Chromulinivorax sp.]
MKNYIFVLSLLLCMHSMVIESSKKEDEVVINFTESTLRECFDGFDHFVEKSKVIDKLKGNKYPLGVVLGLELAYADYNTDIQKGMPAPMARMTMVQMQMAKPMILQRLFQDHPEVLQQLQEQGLYQPKK